MEDPHLWFVHTVAVPRKQMHCLIFVLDGGPPPLGSLSFADEWGFVVAPHQNRNGVICCPWTLRTGGSFAAHHSLLGVSAFCRSLSVWALGQKGGLFVDVCISPFSSCGHSALCVE
eukprot:Gb_23685 [translate_table: standard]